MGRGAVSYPDSLFASCGRLPYPYADRSRHVWNLSPSLTDDARVKHVCLTFTLTPASQGSSLFVIAFIYLRLLIAFIGFVLFGRFDTFDRLFLTLSRTAYMRVRYARTPGRLCQICQICQNSWRLKLCFGSLQLLVRAAPFWSFMSSFCFIRTAKLLQKTHKCKKKRHDFQSRRKIETCGVNGSYFGSVRKALFKLNVESRK